MVVRRTAIAAWILLIAILVLGAALELSGPARRDDATHLRAAPPIDRATSVDTVEIAGRRVSLWRPVPSRTERAPLVVFSHGFHGRRTQSTSLLRSLADAGYLVLAPDHKDAEGGLIGRLRDPVFAPSRQPRDWNDATYRDRADDIRAVVDALRRDDRWNDAIEWSQVALVGHSLGGYTVLGLAGAWPSWTMPEVKAVLALSPNVTPFLSHDTFDGLSAPVMYQTGTRDGRIKQALSRAGGAYDLTPRPAYYVEFKGAGHFAWTDLNKTYHSSIDYYSVAFLDKHVRGDATRDLRKRLPDVADLRVK